MNKIKLVFIASLMSSSFAYAATPCNGFEIKIKNNLADSLLVTSINLKGAELQPGGIRKIDSKTAQVFTVSSSLENVPMAGEFVFHTLTLQSKTVKVQFELKNSNPVCEHTDKSLENDYSVEKMRLPGSVNYTIGYK